MEGIKWEGRGKEGMGRERRGKRLPHECGLATGLYLLRGALGRARAPPALLGLSMFSCLPQKNTE